MAAFLDACRFVPTLGGTTDWTYSATVTGYQSPTLANAVNGTLYKYRAESADLSQWEIGEGAYNSSTGVLARTTVLYNSSGGTSKINFTTVPQVAVVAIKADVGTVQAITAGTGLSGGTINTSGTVAVNLTVLTNSLSADVNQTSGGSTYFPGPQVAQGTSGIWIVFGTITFTDTSVATKDIAKLWDGTTVIDSGSCVSFSAGNPGSISLSGVIVNPAGNLRIDAANTAGSTAGKILFNTSGSSKDSTITAVRIG